MKTKNKVGRKRTYSDEDIKGVIKDYHDGLTGKEITEKWGVCSTTLYTWLNKVGIKFRRHHVEWRDIKKAFAYLGDESNA